MSKYAYHPNPLTNGETGIYTTESGIGGELLILGGVLVVMSIVSVGAYFFGRARGKDITMKQAFVKYGLIDGD